MSDNEKKEMSISKSEKIINIVAIVLCVLLLPILVMNCVLIVKDMIHPNEVSDIFGNIPLIVRTESMEPDIMGGDLIFCKKIDPDDVRIDDVISFFDPDGDGTTIITHKVYDIEIDDETGERAFRTYGINNNTKDWLPVPEENVVGIWQGTRFWQLGAILLFTQSIPGILICVILPIGALVVYEVLRRRKQDAKKQDDIEKLKAELEAMKAGNTANAEVKPEANETSAAEAEEPASDEAKTDSEQV